MATVVDQIKPVAVDTADVAGWNDGQSWQYKITRFWWRHIPRARGWFARLIGRRFGGGMRDTVRTAAGATMAVDPKSLDIYCAIERDGGAWGPGVLQTCVRFLKPGDVFFDIGANVGFISLDAAKQFDDQLKVYAFEPQPTLAKSLAVSASLSGFKNLHVYAIMLGKSAGEGNLYVPTHTVHASALAREGGATVLQCPMVTLDELVESGTLPPPKVIKIDVEGSEWDVFRGAAKTISTHRPFIVFESDFNAGRFGYQRQDLCNYLNELGRYKFYVIEGDHLKSIDGLWTDEDVMDMLAAPEEIDVLGKS